MTNNRLRPIVSANGPPTCPYCEVLLTKTEAAGAACPSCEKPFADESDVELDPHACPKCQGSIIQQRIECVVCGKCGELGPKWGDGTAKCPKCREAFELMELPVTLCESCGWVSIDKRAVQLRRFWQYAAAIIFVGTVVLPALEFWSPKFSVWVFRKFGVTIPIVVWLMASAIGGAVAAAIATPQRRHRKIGAVSGLLGGLGAFGLTWAYLRLMVRMQRESVLSGEVILTTLLGVLPAYWLYHVLEQRQRTTAKRQDQAKRF